MRSGQKIVISILGSVLFFAAVSLAAFLGVFSAVEARFYRPSMVKGIHGRLRNASDVLDLYLDNLKKRFYTDFAENVHVKQSFAFEQTDEAIRGREDAAGRLFAEFPALTAIRIIDIDGKKIHYSTLLSDVFKKSDSLISYKLYKDVAELPYERILSEEGREGKLVFDPERGRILYSFPFYDVYSAYRGTIVFYTAASDFTRELIKLNEASITDSFMFTGTEETPLFVLSFPLTGREILQDILIKRAKDKNIGATEKIVETDDSRGQLLFSQLSRSGIYVARIYEESLFVLSDSLRLVLLLSVFITSFLIIFLILNIKQDDMLIIRDKIRRFQFAVIHDYLKRKEEVDWQAVCADMKRRRQEINIGIKQSLGKKARRHANEVDYLLDKSWDEIIAVLQNQNIPAEKNKAQSLTAELKTLMDVLMNRPELIASFKSASVAPAQASVKEPESLKKNSAAAAVEELSPAGSVEEADAVEELEEMEALEELEETASVSAAPSFEAAAAVEELFPAGSVAEADAVEELEEMEALEELEETASVPAAPSFEAAAAVEELSPAGSVAEADAVEELEEMEALEELKETASVPAAPSPLTESGKKIEKIVQKNEEVLDDDIFYEELRIGEGPSPVNKKTEIPDTYTEDVLAGIEIGMPDFSVLDDLPLSQRKTEMSEADVDTILTDIEMGLPDFSVLDELREPEQTAESKEEKPDSKLIEAEEIRLLENFPFSFTLGKYASAPETVPAFNDSILERDGLFVVSSEAGNEIKDNTLDADFKTLVKSVLK